MTLARKLEVPPGTWFVSPLAPLLAAAGLRAGGNVRNSLSPRTQVPKWLDLFILSYLCLFLFPPPLSRPPFKPAPNTPRHLALNQHHTRHDPPPTPPASGLHAGETLMRSFSCAAGLRAGGILVSRFSASQPACTPVGPS